MFDDKIEDSQLSHHNSLISFSDVYEAIAKSKGGKASGPDCLHTFMVVDGFVYILAFFKIFSLLMVTFLMPFIGPLLFH